MEEVLNWQGTIVYFELYSYKEIDPNDVVDNRTDCESQFNEEFCGEDDLITFGKDKRIGDYILW